MSTVATATRRHTPPCGIPLLLGSGKHVFAGGTVPTMLRLTESVTHPTGTIQLVYETAGVPTYGNLATE